MVPYLSFFPAANGTSFGDGTAQAILSPSQVRDPAFYLGRVDHRISDKDSIFIRYAASPANTNSVTNVVYQGNTTLSKSAYVHIAGGKNFLAHNGQYFPRRRQPAPYFRGHALRGSAGSFSRLYTRRWKSLAKSHSPFRQPRLARARSRWERSRAPPLETQIQSPSR